MVGPGVAPAILLEEEAVLLGKPHSLDFDHIQDTVAVVEVEVLHWDSHHDEVVPSDGLLDLVAYIGPRSCIHLDNAVGVVGILILVEARIVLDSLELHLVEVGNHPALADMMDILKLVVEHWALLADCRVDSQGQLEDSLVGTAGTLAQEEVGIPVHHNMGIPVEVAHHVEAVHLPDAGEAEDGLPVGAVYLLQEGELEAFLGKRVLHYWVVLLGVACFGDPHEVALEVLVELHPVGPLNLVKMGVHCCYLVVVGDHFLGDH